MGGAKGAVEPHRWLGAVVSLEEEENVRKTWLVGKVCCGPGRVKSQAQGREKVCFSDSETADS